MCSLDVNFNLILNSEIIQDKLNLKNNEEIGNVILSFLKKNQIALTTNEWNENLKLNIETNTMDYLLEDVVQYFTFHLRSSNLNRKLFRLDTPLNEYFSFNKNIPIDLYIEEKFILVGGKGGYGANLKGKEAKKQFKKVTDNGACRNLDGQRIRSQDHSAEIAVWKQQAESAREAQRIQEQRNRIEKENNLKKEIIDSVLEESSTQGNIISKAIQESMKLLKKSNNSKSESNQMQNQGKNHNQENELKNQNYSSVNQSKTQNDIKLESKTTSDNHLIPSISTNSSISTNEQNIFQKSKPRKRSLFDENEIFEPKKRQKVETS